MRGLRTEDGFGKCWDVNSEMLACWHAGMLGLQKERGWVDGWMSGRDKSGGNAGIA